MKHRLGRLLWLFLTVAILIALGIAAHQLWIDYNALPTRP